MFLKSARQSVAQNKLLQAPHTWQNIEQGLWWHQALRDWLQEQDPIVFGQYLFTFSGLDVPWVDARIKAQYKVHPGQNADVQAELTALPIAKESVDWAALPFVLEYSADPHQILREVDRTLRTDGCMLIAMSNPYALHSLGRLWPAWRKKNPWRSRLFTPARVLDWLSLLNYQVIHEGYFGYGVPWPSRSGKTPGNSSFIRQFPHFAAGYAVIVRKREWPLTLVRQVQRQSRRSAEQGVVSAGRIQS